MRRILIVALWATSCSVLAQPWCAPGALWHHELNTLSGQGHVREEYVGDTLIDGLTAQKITALGTVWDPGLAAYVTYEDVAIYTHVDNDVVFVRYETQFDTLFDFAALPGEHWSMPGSVVNEYCTDTSGFTVQDTGHMVISGIPLRWLSVEARYSSSYVVLDTIVERLGGLGPTWFWPWISCYLDYGGHSPLRCYSDDELAYVRPNWSYGCSSFDGLPELFGPASGCKIAPNPGTDEVFIKACGRGDPLSIEFRDLTGRILLCAVIKDQGPVDVSSIPVGAYTCCVLDPRGIPLLSGVWVKQ